MIAACHHALLCCIDASLFLYFFGTFIPKAFNIIKENYFTHFAVLFIEQMVMHKPQPLSTLHT